MGVLNFIDCMVVNLGYSPSIFLIFFLASIHQPTIIIDDGLVIDVVISVLKHILKYCSHILLNNVIADNILNFRLCNNIRTDDMNSVFVSFAFITSCLNAFLQHEELD